MSPQPPSERILAGLRKAWPVLSAIVMMVAFIGATDLMGVNTPLARPQSSGTATAMADSTSGDQALTWIREIDALIRAGRNEEALRLSRRYLDHFPDDAGVLYNLACLEERSGDREAAWQALAAAVQRGFDDFRAMADDPDLAAMITDPRFAELKQQRLAALEQLARLRAQQLRAGIWSADLPLAAVSGSELIAAAVTGTCKLRFNAGSLEIEATLRDPHAAGQAPPWRGGPGLFVNVVVPPDSGGIAAETFFACAFGLEARRPLGAVIVANPQHRWHLVAELAPKLHLAPDGETVTYTVILPWTTLAPYGPLTDPRLGINVVYRSIDQDGRSQLAALLPDPVYASTSAAYRRFVPLTLEPGSALPSSLGGKVTAAIIGDATVAAEIVAWSPESVSGELVVALTRQNGARIDTLQSRSYTVDLSTGLERWQPTLAAVELPVASLELSARLRLTTGEDLAWRTALLHLESGWLESARRRRAELESTERATVGYRLDAIALTLKTSPERADPSALATTVVETDAMLERAARTGSVLPAQGRILMVYRGPGGEDRLCSLFLPEFRSESSPLLLVLPPHPRLASELARQTGLQLGPAADPESGLPVVAVPHQVWPAAGQSCCAEVAACRAWATTYLRTPSVLLAGVDAAAGLALQASLDHAQAQSAVCLIAGGGFAPWPEASTAVVLDEVRRASPTLPYYWTRFRDETRRSGQADAVFAAMQQTHLNIALNSLVGGGLSLSQASGRIAQWATALITSER